MSHNTLENYFKTNFSMAQYHKYSITEIENMVVYEKDIYVEMLMQHLKEMEERRKGTSNG